MKQTFSYLVIGICLLLLAFACKHTPDEVVPMVTPPTSTTVASPTPTPLTSTTYTIPTDLATAYADVPQPPADCRIMKMTYKGVNLQGSVINPEEVSIGGKKFTISTKYTITYQYDSQRRLVWQRRLFSTGQPDSTNYIYLPGQVLANITRFEQAGKTYQKQTRDYPVDVRGYPRTVANRQEVDADGFIIRTGLDDRSGSWSTHTVKDFNVISSSTYIAGGFGITTVTSEYYPTRPALPTPTPFDERSERSLIARGIVSAMGSTYWQDGKKVQENFIYEFDFKGRIKRKVVQEIKLSGDWPYETQEGGIGIYDYEYDCP